MTFIWPSMLLSLLVVPLLVAAYLWLLRRRQATAAGFYRFTTAPQAGASRAPGATREGGPAKSAPPRSPGFRRHIPALFSLLSLVIVLVALARPQAQVSLPRVEGTVMLVIDVSGSMAATDAEPSRLDAAKAAARDFILSQPETVQVGIVSFADSGFTVQAPTNDANSLLATIERLEPRSGTSLGQGIVSALYAIAVDAGLAQPEAAQPTPAPGFSPAEGSARPGQAPGQNPGQDPDQRAAALLAQLPDGRYPSAAIVLLSDGENNQSFDPARAALAAAAHGVRIDALGFGTPAGATLEVEGFNVHTALDEAALERITHASGGKYYPAGGDQDLREVYSHLTPQLVIKPEWMEITSILAGAGLLLLLMGSMFSMRWFNRLV